MFFIGRSGASTNAGDGECRDVPCYISAFQITASDVWYFVMPLGSQSL
jgi:hypothetical protein